MRRNVTRKRNNSKTALVEEHKQTELLRRIAQLETSNLTSPLQVVQDVPRIILKRDKIFSFQRSVVVGNLSGSATIEQPAALFFSLSSLPGFTDFQSLFDAYRIMQVTVYFTPLGTTINTGNLVTAIDTDDATMPSSGSDLEQYDSFRITPGGHYCERTLTPKASLSMYGGVSSYYGPALQTQWIDIAYSTVQYYGLKYSLYPLGGGTVAGVYTVSWSVILQFKYSR